MSSGLNTAPWKGEKNSVHVGAYKGTNRITGLLDDIHVFNRALSAQEVASLFCECFFTTCNMQHAIFNM